MELKDITFRKHSEREIYFIECPDPYSLGRNVVLASTHPGSTNSRLALEFINLLKNLQK